MLRAQNDDKALVGCVTIFTGFLQTRSSPGSGFLQLYRDAYLTSVDVLRSKLGYFQTQVFPYDADVSDIAESMWRYRPWCDGSQVVDCDQWHLVAGYSYGGQAAINFVRELQHRGGVRVVELALCDPVRRWKFLPGLAAATGLGVLEIPSIVDNVWWYRQKNKRFDLFRSTGGIFQPSGHDLVAEDSDHTRIQPPVIVRSGHVYIDDDKDFRAKFNRSVRSVATRILERVS